MKLNAEQVKFITRFWERLYERMFIIDCMTLVGNRPQFSVFTEEFPTEQNRSVTININSGDPTIGNYSSPLPLDILPDYLKNDPIHKWRAETGIELIHEEPTFYEQIRIWRNWTLMSDDQKAQSDKKSIEIFGCTNLEHHKEIMNATMTLMTQKKWFIVGDIIELIDEDKKQSCVCYVDELDIEKGSITITYLGSGDTRLFGETDEFTLQPGVLKCCNEPIETTVGRFLLNVLLIEYPFEGIINYVNDAGFDLKGVEKQISDLLMNKGIRVNQYKMFVDHLYFIGHFTELCVPTYSRAALTTDPKIKDLKKELLQKYAGRLDDPKVIAEIESILIEADKAYLKDDISMRFLKPVGGKAFNVARKKMYLTVGGIEAFSKDSGKYEFINNALADGWDPNAIPAIANEIRKGSYNRGHETQLGGALTKYIVRVFQDLVINEDDCRSTRGLTVDFSKYPVKEYIGRYIWANGKEVMITKENMNEFTGKRYSMRSPMYCRAAHGLCKKCAGDVYAKLNAKHLAMFVVDISSTFTTMALKLMHGSKLELEDIGDLNQYVIEK